MIGIATQRAANGRRRIGWIVGVLIVCFSGRSHSRENAIAVCRVRLSGGVQIVLCFPCPGERPFVFVAPLFGAHDENPYALGASKLIGRILEQMVVPTKSHRVFIEGSGGTEVHVSDLLRRSGVATNSD